MAKDKYQQKIGFLTNGQKKIKTEIEELETMLIDLGKKNLKGIYTDEDYLKMKQSIEVDLITKKGQLGDSKIETLELEESLNFIKYYFSHFDRAWIDASPLGRY